MQNTTANPHLILFFDVNGTMILEDSTKKESPEYMLNNALAKNTFANWEGQTEAEEKICRISFKQYVDHVLVPGDKSDAAIKRQRQDRISGFVDWLSQSSHDCKDQVLDDYSKIREKFTNPSTGEVNFTIFNSFYHMLDTLREKEIPFTIVLRSFGHDLRSVVREIQDHPSGITINRWAKFEQTTFTIEQIGTVEKVEDIFDLFLSSPSHFAVQDDWKRWNLDGELGRSGKPFIYDASGSRGRENLSLLFDDNVTGEMHDIVCPCEISGQNEPIHSLYGKQVFAVNTRDAALDDHYFTDRVLQAIKIWADTKSSRG